MSALAFFGLMILVDLFIVAPMVRGWKTRQQQDRIDAIDKGVRQALKRIKAEEGSSHD